MNFKFTISMVILSVNIIVSAQINSGAKDLGLSNSTVAFCDDVFAINLNPAGLSKINRKEFGIYFSPSPFGLKELATWNVAFLMPFNFGNITAAYTSYGYDLYEENIFSFSFSKKINKNFMVGITSHIFNLNIRNYGSANSFLLDAGIIYLIHKDLSIGFSIKNIFRTVIGKEKSELPTVYNIGGGYKVNKNFLMTVALQKDLEHKTSFRCGLEYQLIKYFILRTGFMDYPESYSAGFGIKYSHFQLDYSFFTHLDLGTTHQAGIIIRFDE